jgi:hypothetical protein
MIKHAGSAGGDSKIEETMRYFTPELYLRFNSTDRQTVEQAHEDWETALAGYRKHLQAIRPRMAKNVWEIAESLCLHDAAYLGMNVSPILDHGGALSAVMLRRENTDLILAYFLAEEPLAQEVNEPWPFSKEKVHWLYDEFDVRPDGTFQHEVLLSNGHILTLRFHQLRLLEHQFKTPAVAKRA